MDRESGFVRLAVGVSSGAEDNWGHKKHIDKSLLHINLILAR